MSRVISWFSCGAASAVTSKIVAQEYGDRAVIAYCDTSKHEHPDNERFLKDVERWIGLPILRLRRPETSPYADMDIYGVFSHTKFLRGPKGARCTTELKKKVRQEYQEPDDIHALGYTVDEPGRVAQFRRENPELYTDFPLVRHGIRKTDTYRILRQAGIRLPEMYRLGYRNNNCIGCVKGGLGYWNKIRRDFPAYFARMAAQERALNHALNRREVGQRGTPEYRTEDVYLDELDPTLGRYEAEPDIECGVMCVQQQLF